MFQTKTFYQKTLTGKIIAWKITQKQDKLVYEWGYTDSSHWQKTEEYIKPIHEGTIANKTAEVNATLVFERKIQKRLDAGYFPTEEEAGKTTINIDLDNLTKAFSPAKPISSKPCLDKKDPTKSQIPNATIASLIKEKRLWAQRKANGCRGLYVKTENNSYFLSRKIKDISKNFPILKSKLDDLSIPSGTLLDMEITLGGGHTMTQAIAVSSMSPNTKPERAEEIYKEWLEKNPNDYLTSIVFDVIFFKGSSVISLPYEERYEILESLLPYHENNYPRHNGNPFSYIIRPYIYTDFQKANDIAKEKNWEGLVLWDKEMTSEYTVNGKPKRIKGCWKWKSDKVADCFILDILPQEGNPSLVGALSIGQYDEKGKLIKCGNVGAGLTEETRQEAWQWKGKVAMIKYFERMKTNAEGEICFQFPVILQLRDDKPPGECIFEEDEQ